MIASGAPVSVTGFAVVLLPIARAAEKEIEIPVRGRRGGGDRAATGGGRIVRVGEVNKDPGEVGGDRNILGRSAEDERTVGGRTERDRCCEDYFKVLKHLLSA